MPSKAQTKTKPAGLGGQEISSSELKELQDNIVKRLIKTGEWDRISAVLKDRLSESGWTDETYNNAKESARQQQPLHFKTLMTEMVPNAEAAVPPEVKEEVLALIRKFIEENTSSS
ncbi:SAGA histone acetylase and TREX-2 complexes component [Tulasnella sp. 427]|nr:SAGA histone acetylase and TREX-2 complexes component [Tulasnella sp. 427]